MGCFKDGRLKMTHQLKCYCCGKFISDKDYLSKKLHVEDIWNWDKTELEDVAYYCIKCTAKIEGLKRQGSEQTKD